MPPRYSYWTIIAGGLPTAFRAGDQAELLPTLHRLRQQHPDAVMKYFAHGKLWASRDEAQLANRRPPRETRGRDWRPGGNHRDPRQPFKDAKKARNQDRRTRRWTSTQERHRGAGAPHGDPPRAPTHGGWAKQDPRGRTRGRFPSTRGQQQPEPPIPRDPDHEPRPSEVPKPTPPPRPTEPVIAPPGPPERGNAPRKRGFRPSAPRAFAKPRDEGMRHDARRRGGQAHPQKRKKR